MVCLRDICINTLHKGDDDDDDDDDDGDDDDNDDDYDDDDDNNNNNNNNNGNWNHLTVIQYQSNTLGKHESNYIKQPYWALHTCFGKC